MSRFPKYSIISGKVSLFASFIICENSRLYLPGIAPVIIGSNIKVSFISNSSFINISEFKFKDFNITPDIDLFGKFSIFIL